MSRKTSSRKVIVSTTTRIGGIEFVVSIRRTGSLFRLCAGPSIYQDTYPRRGPALRALRWGASLNEKEADGLVASLAAEFGYEVVDRRYSLNVSFANMPVGIIGAKDGMLELHLFRSTDFDAAVAISTEAAQKILEALAKELDWDLTG